MGAYTLGPQIGTCCRLTQCTAQLLAHPDRATSRDGDITATSIPEVDALATRLLLTRVYAPDASPAAPPAVRAAVRTVLAAPAL